MLTVEKFANSSPVPVSVTFKRSGSNYPVAGFAASDIIVDGGSVSSFSSSGGGGHTYTFQVTPALSLQRLPLPFPRERLQVGAVCIPMTLQAPLSWPVTSLIL